MTAARGSSAQERARGCLMGLALGDALAAPTEFLSVEAIVARWPEGGPQDVSGSPARVTDDTQMTLAVGRALMDADHADGDARWASLEAHLTAHYAAWWAAPDNDRAPGKTCLTACAALADGTPWREATVSGSKGCGANMRVAPIALRFARDPDTRARAAQLQAALTHGHPTALAASDATAHALALLLTGLPLADLPAALDAHAVAQREVYHARPLGALWQRPAMPSPAVFIARGWDELRAALARIPKRPSFAALRDDPCATVGDGWIAEEALACALACALSRPDDPVAAVRRAAVTGGDSDSIAAITGALVGAAYGIDAWPEPWRAAVEHGPELERLALELAAPWGAPEPLRVYLDDVRPAPPGWERVRWPDQAVALLERADVAALSLDHDLGDDARGTGYDVLEWLERAVVLDGRAPPEVLRVHSANVAARRRMEQAIAAIERAAARR